MTTLPIAARPEAAGIDSERLEALFARAKRDVDDGVLPGCAVAVARQGKLAGYRVFGEATCDGVARPVGADTLFCLFSSTKGVVSVATWLLLEAGLLRLDERIADVIPEFATNGKEAVTIEQAYLHIGGFPLAPLGPGKWETKQGRIAAFERWRLTFEPGSKFEYHPSSLHWVLAEIIERRTGIEYRQFLRERLLEPMGVSQDLFVGLPAALNARTADIVYCAPPVAPPGGFGEVTPEAILRFNKPEVRAVGVPGGGGYATAAGIAMFYQPLVNGGRTFDGRQILKPETIEMATRPRTDGRHVDPIFQKPIMRALGVQTAGDREDMVYRGFGRTASPRAFGHAGAGGQVAWADPDSGISVGYTTHGFVDPEVSGRRTAAISSLAGACAIA